MWLLKSSVLLKKKIFASTHHFNNDAFRSKLILASEVHKGSLFAVDPKTTILQKSESKHGKRNFSAEDWRRKRPNNNNNKATIISILGISGGLTAGYLLFAFVGQEDNSTYLESKGNLSIMRIVIIEVSSQFADYQIVIQEWGKMNLAEPTYILYFSLFIYKRI